MKETISDCLIMTLLGGALAASGVPVTDKPLQFFILFGLALLGVHSHDILRKFN